MHTSTILNASDFQYRRQESNEFVRVRFSEFCPNYHELDRIGVVSPEIEDGVCHTSYALLALTTAFYDCLRSRTNDFFDYPQHFAFVGAHKNGRSLDKSAIGPAWGNLDVWPDSNWILTPTTATGLMKKVFDFQINRLFWPENFKPAQGEGLLPAYVRKMFRSRLKAIYYYNPTNPNLEIHVTQPVQELVQRSFERLPIADVAELYQRRQTTAVEQYWQVGVDDFLTAMDSCFANTKTED